MAASAPEQAPPIDLSHHYSRTTKNRNASAIKGFYKYFKIPNIGNLAGGLPNHNYFPFDTLEGAAALPHRFTPTPNKPVDPPIDILAATSLFDNHSSSQVVVPATSDSQDVLHKIDLKSALQYGTAQGYPPLYTFLRQFTIKNMHPNIPYKDGPEIILTNGNTDGFSKTLEALTNPWDAGRDWIRDREGLLVEEYAYMGAIQTARPRGLNTMPVRVDDEGMVVNGEGGLQDVLENWDARKGKRPHLMYTVTIGQNPTSGVLSLTRRRAIYALCVQFDIIIIEDDPYWYLQYPSANPARFASLTHDPTLSFKKSTSYPFLDSLVPSYLSIDTQGRVVRLDTFSKTVAPGCRLGWITTQPALCERLLRITECSTQQPSGFVQSIIAQLIIGASENEGRGGGKDDKGWQPDGWVRWLEGLRGNYERRMQSMCRILDAGSELVASTASTPSNQSCAPEEWNFVDTTTLYSFNWPMGGMFVWVRMHFETHPLWEKVDHDKLAHALWVHLTTPKFLVLVAPGIIFATTDQIAKESSWRYFRICFAAVDEDEVERTSRAFVEGVRDFWGKTELGDVEELARGEKMDVAGWRGVSGSFC